MSNEGISGSNPLVNSLQEISKLRGLENTALQNAQHKQKPDAEVAKPAFVVEIGRSEVTAPAYVPPSVRAEAANLDHSSRADKPLGFRTIGEDTSVESTKKVEGRTEEAKGVQVNLQQGVATKLKEQVQRMDGNGEAVIAGRNASARNSVQTDQSVASATLVVSDGHNVKASLQIDMVAMTAPKTLTSPISIPVESPRPDLPPTAMDALEGVATTAPDALEQPSREEAIAANQGEIAERDKDMDARWLLLQDTVQSMKGHIGWQLDKNIPTDADPGGARH
jgi:hypothetical protein